VGWQQWRVSVTGNDVIGCPRVVDSCRVTTDVAVHSLFAHGFGAAFVVTRILTCDSFHGCAAISRLLVYLCLMRYATTLTWFSK
jgi:hypothetical protein